MILTRQDVVEFELAFDHFCDESLKRHRTFENTYPPLRNFLRSITDMPQVLMAGGFQEYVPSQNLAIYRRLVKAKRLMPGLRPVLRTFDGHWLLISHIIPYRDIAWAGVSLHALGAEHFPDGHARLTEMPSADALIRAAETLLASPRADVTAFVSSKLWTPRAQSDQRLVLQESVVSVMKALQTQHVTLRDVSPRQFEEIVAEILRRRGMEIHVVRESPQGGRDLIARGQLIPGLEPLTIAVEVKHRAVIDRPEVQKALHQNRRFPALLFVTSGRFSGGVITEAALSENRLRLFLQDGIAVRDVLKAIEL